MPLRRGFLALSSLLVALLTLPAPSTATTIRTDDGLYPDFTPRVHDYVSHCAGDVKVNVSHLSGKTASIAGKPYRRGPVNSTVRKRAGARVVVAIKRPHRGKVERYNIRCLPTEFLDWDFERLRRPHEQFYIVPSGVQPVGDGYVTIFDRRGTPVWWIHTPRPLFDAKLLPDDTMSWSYAGLGAFTVDEDEYYQRYRLDGTRQRSVRAVGVTTDGHDMQQMPNGDYLVIAYKPRDHVDLSPYGGPSDATVVDAEVQQVTPKGKLVWRWNSKDHVSLAETGRWWPAILTNPLFHPQLPDGRTAYDIVHANSIEPVGKSVLLSLRHLDAILMIRRSTGDIQWKLGGTETSRSLSVKNDPLGDYPLGAQHDARDLPGDVIAAHDNGSALNRPPRGVAYRINSQARTATLVDSQADPEALGSFCCGSAQMFPGGGWLIDWGGAVPTQITEFDPQHRRTFRFTFTFHGVSPATTYRVESVPDGRLELGDLRKAMDDLAAKGLAAPAPR